MLHEARRSTNKNMQLTFPVVPDLDGKRGWEQFPIELHQRFPGSGWYALLDHVRRMTYAVIEMVFDRCPFPLASSRRRYVTARHLIVCANCQWNDAVAEYRQVLDDLTVTIGQSWNVAVRFEPSCVM